MWLITKDKNFLLQEYTTSIRTKKIKQKATPRAFFHRNVAETA
jgi:hypothetical protein